MSLSKRKYLELNSDWYYTVTAEICIAELFLISAYQILMNTYYKDMMQGHNDKLFF